jgi:PadR family transcriptional regulator AphA
MATTTAARDRATATGAAEVSFAEHVCLVLTVQGVSHGWAIGTMLGHDGEVGRIWSLSRPLTYRAIDRLVDKRLVSRRGHSAGRGRDRVLLAPTAAGRRTASRWLDAPVQHLRDVRTELLVKLFLRRRAGLDNVALLVAQREQFRPTIDALTSSAHRDDLVDLWRRESARAVRRFLDEALHPPDAPVALKPELRLSARNQLRAKVDTVTHGEVMSTVRLTLPDGQQITAAITKDAAEDLRFDVGDDVTVVIKSTEVMLAKE